MSSSLPVTQCVAGTFCMDSDSTWGCPLTHRVSNETLVGSGDSVDRVIIEAAGSVPLPRLHPQGGVQLNDVALCCEDVVRGTTVHHVVRVKQLNEVRGN